MNTDETIPNPTPSPELRADAIDRAKRSSQALTGVVLVVLGVLFLIDRMGWQWGLHLSFGHLWPILLIVAGIGTAMTDRETEVRVTRDVDGKPQTEVQVKSRRRLGDGLFLVLVGVLMLLHVNHKVSLTQSWPLFVVAGGLSILFGRSGCNGRRARREGR